MKNPIMSDEYKKALDSLSKASVNLEKARQLHQKAAEEVELARSDLSVGCRCGQSTPVRDVPFFEEAIPGIGWDGALRYKSTWLCIHCGEESNDIRNELFPNGIKRYSTRVFEWHREDRPDFFDIYDYSYAEPKEVTKLRARWRAKKKHKFNDERRKRKIEAAKNLLKEEGINIEE